MKRYNLFLIAFFLIIKVCEGQAVTTKNTFFNADFKWAITIPDSFEPVSSKQYTALRKYGTAMMEKTINGKIEDTAKLIYSFKSDLFNYFEANQQPFDIKIDGDYLAHCKEEDNAIYDTYKRLSSSAFKIDTAISTETIDGLKFQFFKLHMTYHDKMAFDMMVYSKLFEKKEFTVVILYNNKLKGDLIINAWKNSKFDKN